MNSHLTHKMATKKKTIVGKSDLRRLMKEQRGSSHANAKKIESPLAKYNSMGQLLCVLCTAPIKSELMWNAHVLGKTHKENLLKLKGQKETAFVQPAAPPPVKRKPPDGGSLHTGKGKISRVESYSSKKTKGVQGLPADFFDSVPGGSQKSAAPKASLGLGDYSSSSDEEEDVRDRAPAPSMGAIAASATSSMLPADFFDQGVMPSSSHAVNKEDEDEQKPLSMAEKLPEGFFDDPKKDAKVRQVEYRDKMDDEWDLFQKAMKEETTKSEAIVEEDEDEATEERTIDEIDEQMIRWSRIDRLAKQKEQIMTKEGSKPKDIHQDEGLKAKEGDEEDDDDDLEKQEFEEFLDWRTKKAWK